MTDDKVYFIGKVAKFPKNTKASKALQFLENIKISKNKIWYIIVEQQTTELQMLKYNLKNDMDLSKFSQDLKEYYLKNYSDQERLSEIIENLEIVGEDKFVVIKNIPRVKLAGKPLISRITEDLIQILGE